MVKNLLASAGDTRDAGSNPWVGKIPWKFPGESDATHSSILAEGIPGTGESGGLPSMESHRVGHD